MNATLNQTALNGINLTALAATMDSIRQDPAMAKTTWTIHSRWMGGTRSDHEVKGCRIGDKDVRRSFTLRTDEPHELCGTNQYANPQEYLMSAMNACMMVGYAAVAALMGVKLTRLEVRTTGDIDLRGFFGMDEKVPAGYPELRQEVHIAGDGTPEQFRQIHETVKATSPNFFNITRAIPTRSELMLER